MTEASVFVDPNTLTLLDAKTLHDEGYEVELNDGTVKAVYRR